MIEKGHKCTVEFWFAALTIRVRILGEIHDEIVRHCPSIEDSIASMLHDVRLAFGFEEITEENIKGTELGSKLDEIGKMDITEENLRFLALSELSLDSQKNIRWSMRRHYRQQVR